MAKGEERGSGGIDFGKFIVELGEHKKNTDQTAPRPEEKLAPKPETIDRRLEPEDQDTAIPAGPLEDFRESFKLEEPPPNSTRPFDISQEVRTDPAPDPLELQERVTELMGANSAEQLE